jgi:hypothetical protein
MRTPTISQLFDEHISELDASVGEGMEETYHQ